MKLDDFSGGRNTRVTPSKIQPTEAQVYTNIDNTSGAMKPLKCPLTTGVVIDEWFTYYYGNTEWISRVVDSDFVEYRDRMYISNGTGALEEYSASGSRSVGIVGPIATVPLSDVSIGTSPITITEVPGGTMALGGSFNYRLALHSSVIGKIIYKDYSFTLSAYSAAGYNINFNIKDLNTSYFANGDDIILYRETSSGYKRVGIVDYNTAGVNIVDSILNITANADLPSDYAKVVYNYVYTYYDATTGRESKPSLPSIDQVNGVGTTLIGALPKSSDLTEANLTHIRVYRLGGLLTQYTLLDELAYPTTTTTPYIDTKDDLDIVGNEVLDSLFNDAPISGLKYITEAYAMLFAVKDDKLYYSDIAKPYAWPATNFIDFEGDITGVGLLSVGLLVFTRYKAYIITGNSPDSFSKFLYSGSQGCVSHKSIQFVDDKLIWISEDGICATSGGEIQVVSLPMLGKISFYQIYSTAVHDNAYYISYKEGLSDYMLVFDFRYNTIVKDISVPGRHVVAKKDGLYQYYSGTLRQLFAGSTDLEMSYKSGVLTEGEYSNYKTYKDVFIRYNGAITFKVFIDGTEINSVDLTGNNVYNLKLASGSKGYGIEFAVTGTGIVYEIKYSIEGSQNV